MIIMSNNTIIKVKLISISILKYCLNSFIDICIEYSYMRRHDIALMILRRNNN